MNKILYRYFIYFVVFIFLVQLIENNQFQLWLASCGFRISLEPLGTYAPLFLSALLIDITYQIGKHQNRIAEQQNKMERHRMYKEIYSLVVLVDRETNHLVQNLYEIFINYIVTGINFIEINIDGINASIRMLQEEYKYFNGKIYYYNIVLCRFLINDCD